MAACSELEEKTSSSEDTLHIKISLQESTDQKNAASNKLSEEATTGDLTTLSDDEFLHLLKEASTFNKPNNHRESHLLTQLRKEAATKESLENDSFEQHEQSDMSLCNTTSSSNHRTSDGKRKTKPCGDLKNALNSDKNVQQSLSLQDLLCPETKSKKSHKAHRTHSLSSEEAVDLLCESTSAFQRTAKKSNKQSNSSKCNAWKCNPKSSCLMDSSQKRKLEFLVSNNSSLPYENECDIPLPSALKPEQNDKLNNDSESPIEMYEIPTLSEEDHLSSMDKTSKHQGNSKFYVDSNEVLENGQVDFPLSNWASPPMQVQSLLQSLPLDPDTYRGDKQLLSPDINGNQFFPSSRPSLTSFISTSIMDYSNTNLLSEVKNRKNKRTRNSNNNKGVLSENIEGHRGRDDIDVLLQFINSSDKKGKPTKGYQGSHMLTNKAMFHENDKKKILGKEVKNCHKSMKKLSRSNSLENLLLDSRQQDKNNSLSYESNAILDKPLKSSKIASFQKQILDINSNVQTQFSTSFAKSKKLDDFVRLDESFDECPPEVSSFAADFYSTADVSSQTIEESGFLIVKKKKRRHPSKRSDYRWRSNQTPRKKGMMIPLAESKCGKQDSRRKSTSSVPHSEHSSADNSDLDSVHSLPVRGSVRPPKQPHPHTTPSSSSSTPQASYADIARMPIPKLNSTPPCIITYSAQPATAKQMLCCGHDLQKSDQGTRQRMPPECSRSSIHVNDCVCSAVKVRSLAKSTREINTQTEPELSVGMTDAMQNKKSEESSKIVCNICTCPVRKNCSCFKSQSVLRQKVKPSHIPPVIMDNMPTEMNVCNVSFGFGVDEVLQMEPTKHSSELQDEALEVDLCSDSKDFTRSASVVRASDYSPFQDCDPCSEISSHLQTVCYGVGRNISYCETEVNTKKFNLSEITNFLGMEFRHIENELGVSKRNSCIHSKNVYYTDSAEET